MEMPKNCAECHFSDVFAYPPDYDDEWICELNQLSMSWEDAQIRNPNCPLPLIKVDLRENDGFY